MWNPLAWSKTGTPWCTQAQVNGLGTTRQVCSTGPPQPMKGSKRDWMSGDQGWMSTSSSPHHSTMLIHIMAFPADRLGMPLFVLVLYSWALWNVKLRNMQRKHWISPSLTSIYLFVSLNVLVNSMQAWEWPDKCLEVEVKWDVLDHITLYTVRVCFLHCSYVLCI